MLFDSLAYINNLLTNATDLLRNVGVGDNVWGGSDNRSIDAFLKARFGIDYYKYLEWVCQIGALFRALFQPALLQFRFNARVAYDLFSPELNDFLGS